jgi:uncharacterized protein
LAVLVDTSALYALMDRTSHMHDAVRGYVTGSGELLLVPVTTLPELDYLVTERLGSRVALQLLRSIVSGEMRLEEVTSSDLERCIELMEQYGHTALGLVDASIIAVAERLRISTVLTLDQRHFRFVHPRHCAGFDLVP